MDPDVPELKTITNADELLDVLPGAQPIFLIAAGSSPMAAAVDCRVLSSEHLSVDGLREALIGEADGREPMSQWRDYNVLLILQNDEHDRTLTQLLEEASIHAHVGRYVVRRALLEQAAPFLFHSGGALPVAAGRFGSGFPHRVVDKLYLGDLDAAKNPLLLPMGVRFVVDASNLNRRPFADHGVEYLAVSLWDTEDQPIEDHFEAVSAFLLRAEQQGAGALVHCAAGVSRSSTLVIAHLMLARRMSLEQAYRLVKQRRSVICPNSGFARQLMALEQRLFQTASFPDPKTTWFTLEDLVRRKENLARQDL